MLIPTNESFRIKYNITRGMEMEFYKSNSIIDRQPSLSKSSANFTEVSSDFFIKALELSHSQTFFFRPIPLDWHDFCRMRWFIPPTHKTMTSAAP